MAPIFSKIECGSVRVNFRHFFLEEQIVQRTKRTVFFYLVDGHFVPVDGQFDKAAPAVVLMGADFPYILGIAVRTSKHDSHPIS